MTRPAFTPSQLATLRLADAAEDQLGHPGRPRTNLATLLISDGALSPEAQMRNLKRAGRPIPPDLRLRWRAYVRLSRMPKAEREAMGRAVMHRLKRDLAKLTNTEA